MPDLPVRRMSAIAERVDHRVLVVRATPPGDETVRLSIPALPLQEGCDGLGEPLLHIDDGAVLVERQHLDFAPQDAKRFRHVLLPARERSATPRIAYAARYFQAIFSIAMTIELLE